MIKSTARLVFHASGALHAARWLKRRQLRILMYHRFRDRDAIARQCTHIRAHYTPVSLSQAADWLQSGAWPDNALAITVDDGYRDFYQIAYPIFREYGMRATVYLVSDFVDRRQWLWVDRVRWSYLNSATALGSREERLKTAYTAIEAAKLMANSERLAWLDSLPAALGVQPPEQPPPDYEPMTWDEVRDAAMHGIDFGAHTVTHPILSRLGAPAELRAEIEGSKRRLESELGRPVEHFCYPNGASHDFTAEAVDIVRAAGFRTATTTGPGTVSRGDDPYRLRRIGVAPDYEERYFAECATALHTTR
jgi:peptidoglycan/xylan/chitin deacetylase (PgdA/CDA1 family)